MPVDPEQSDSEKGALPEPSEEIEDVEPHDEELSLEQLSRAYAEVLQGRDDDDDDDEEEEGADEDSEEIGDTDDELACDEDFDEAGDDESEHAHATQRPAGLEPAAEDEQDNAGCTIDPETILEAILFVGCPPDSTLKARQIASIMRDVSPKEIRALVKKLNANYKSCNAPYRIVSDAGNLKMELVDDKEMQQVRSQFYGEVRQAKLNQNAIDVLAVVAYHQPVSKEEIEKIRIRPSGPVINQMVRRQLLTFETTETKPRRKLYSTTDRFLELFQLNSLIDLPQTNPASDLDELAD